MQHFGFQSNKLSDYRISEVCNAILVDIHLTFTYALIYLSNLALFSCSIIQETKLKLSSPLKILRTYSKRAFGCSHIS